MRVPEENGTGFAASDPSLTSFLAFRFSAAHFLAKWCVFVKKNML